EEQRVHKRSGKDNALRFFEDCSSIVVQGSGKQKKGLIVNMATGSMIGGVVGNNGMIVDQPLSPCFNRVGIGDLRQCEVGSIIVRVPGEISLLFNKYEEVFTIPTTLHPERNFNHKLPLKEGTLPIQTIPYKYPLTRKEAIGVMIRELFDPGGKRVYVISVTTSRSEYDAI
ncbi:hypothetical protein Tco_0393019, partial [Tanacetum coccineum]